MIRLRKVSLVNDVRKNRTPLFYWSISAGFITTVSFITFGYFLYSYRIKQRTKEGIQKGQVDRIIHPQGLNSQEIQKAIALLEKQQLHDQIQLDNYERYKRLRDKRREQEVSNDHVNHIVQSILNKRQRNVLEQQQTFIRRNTDENNKRNNSLIDKFTIKKPTNSSKENVISNPIIPKKKTIVEINNDDDDDDFVSIKKPAKIIKPSKIDSNIIKTDSNIIKTDPIKECLESIILQIENNEATCPICNQVLSYLTTIDQRQQHVNRCLEESQINNIETKHQKSLLSYTKFSSTIRKPISSTVSLNFKCQICGMSFNVKRTYLSHLKKCSNQNSIQLKHVVNFAAKTTTTNEPQPITTVKKKTVTNIKNRIIKMEVPITEDDEQQQLAIALSASIKTATEPPNAFDILQAASKKIKTIDLLTTPLWNVSIDDKLKLCSARVSNICERLITIDSSANSYKFPPSSLLLISQTNFGHVNWWNITTTDPQDDEIPMTQLARLLEDNES
ncbi:unnamed protein product [Adineta steineri]|uniref:C2H2-type domain-containing protein n=2 Tax=Adineta steineri TaxID=433720 RepID=A0A818UVT6_9BILA|nr:unnamed protein product [Adineta steineri]